MASNQQVPPGLRTALERRSLLLRPAQTTSVMCDNPRPCRYGERCMFAHGFEESRLFKETREAARLKDGERGMNSSYASSSGRYGAPPQRQQYESAEGASGGGGGDQPWCHPAKYKTTLCLHWDRRGDCRHGATCNFAHGQAELRAVSHYVSGGGSGGYGVGTPSYGSASHAAYCSSGGGSGYTSYDDSIDPAALKQDPAALKQAYELQQQYDQERESRLLAQKLQRACSGAPAASAAAGTATAAPYVTPAGVAASAPMAVPSPAQGEWAAVSQARQPPASAAAPTLPPPSLESQEDFPALGAAAGAASASAGACGKHSRRDSAASSDTSEMKKRMSFEWDGQSLCSAPATVCFSERGIKRVDSTSEGSSAGSVRSMGGESEASLRSAASAPASLPSPSMHYEEEEEEQQQEQEGGQQGAAADAGVAAAAAPAAVPAQAVEQQQQGVREEAAPAAAAAVAAAAGADVAAVDADSPAGASTGSGSWADMEDEQEAVEQQQQPVAAAVEEQHTKQAAAALEEQQQEQQQRVAAAASAPRSPLRSQQHTAASPTAALAAAVVAPPPPPPPRAAAPAAVPCDVFVDSSAGAAAAAAAPAAATVQGRQLSHLAAPMVPMVPPPVHGQLLPMAPPPPPPPPPGFPVASASRVIYQPQMVPLTAVPRPASAPTLLVAAAPAPVAAAPAVVAPTVQVVPAAEVAPTAARPVFLQRIAGQGVDLSLVPHFMCPLTSRPFVHPVVAADGITYEKEVITDWLYRQNKEVSPVTGKQLAHRLLLPNDSLRAAMAEVAELLRAMMT